MRTILLHECSYLYSFYTYLDTLSLAKDLFPDYKKYKLGKIADNLGIKVEVAHRALDDVDTTVKVFNVMLKKLKDKGTITTNVLEGLKVVDIIERIYNVRDTQWKKNA